MKIILLTPSVRLLGARQSLLSLAQRISQTDDVLVICPSEGDLTKALKEASVPCKTAPHGAWRKATGHIKSRFQQVPALRRIIHEFQPDIVHCNEFHITPQAATALKRTVVNGGVNLKPDPFSTKTRKNQENLVENDAPQRDSRVNRGMGGKSAHDQNSSTWSLDQVALTSHVRLSITPRQIQNYYMERCDRIVAVSQACRDLFEGYPIHPQTEVIYNGIDLDDFFDGKRDGKSEIRQQQNWDSDDFVVGLLGLVSPRKNQLVAIEALRILNKNPDAPKVRLLLAGDPFKSTMDYGDEVRQAITDPGISDSVLWMDFQKDVRPLYQAMDANLLISSEEGFGRTIIEAGALGRPSIGSKIGGIPELIIDAETGLLVDEGNADQLAQSILKLAREKEFSLKMGAAAKQRVAKNFTLDAYTDSMRTCWQRAIDQRMFT